jgi:hypothetical protein
LTSRTSPRCGTVNSSTVPSKLATRSETSGTTPPQCSQINAASSASLSSPSSLAAAAALRFRFFFFFGGCWFPIESTTAAAFASGNRASKNAAVSADSISAA